MIWFTRGEVISNGVYPSAAQEVLFWGHDSEPDIGDDSFTLDELLTSESTADSWAFDLLSANLWCQDSASITIEFGSEIQ